MQGGTHVGCEANKLHSHLLYLQVLPGQRGQILVVVLRAGECQLSAVVFPKASKLYCRGVAACGLLASLPLVDASGSPKVQGPHLDRTQN